MSAPRTSVSSTLREKIISLIKSGKPIIVGLDFDGTQSRESIHNEISRAKLNNASEEKQMAFASIIKPLGEKEKIVKIYTRLINHGAKLGILSQNEHPVIVHRYLSEVIGLGEIMKHITLCSFRDYNNRGKRDHIDVLLRHLGMEDEKIFLVEDNEENLEGAKDKLHDEGGILVKDEESHWTFLEALCDALDELKKENVIAVSPSPARKTPGALDDCSLISVERELKSTVISEKIQNVVSLRVLAEELHAQIDCLKGLFNPTRIIRGDDSLPQQRIATIAGMRENIRKEFKKDCFTHYKDRISEIYQDEFLLIHKKNPLTIALNDPELSKEDSSLRMSPFAIYLKELVNFKLAIPPYSETMRYR